MITLLYRNLNKFVLQIIIMRLFIGIPVPDELKQRILPFQQELGRLGDIKLVEPVNIHFTLKFLGEVGEGRVNELCEVLTNLNEHFARFGVSLRGLGAFPSAKEARIIWIGLSNGGDELGAAASLLDSELSKIGFPSEQRPFSCHLTLGRVRETGRNPALQRFIEENKNTEFGTMKVDRVLLIKSVLGPDGPKYEEVFRVDLR